MVRVQITQNEAGAVDWATISGRFGDLTIEKSVPPHDDDSYITLRQVSVYKVGSIVLMRDEVRALRGVLTRLLEDMG